MDNCTCLADKAADPGGDLLSELRGILERMEELATPRPQCFLFLQKTWDHIVGKMHPAFVDTGSPWGRSCFLWGIPVHLATNEKEYRLKWLRLRFIEAKIVVRCEEDFRSAFPQKMPELE